MTSLLDQFRRVGRDLYATGLVSSHGGNMSVRRGDSWGEDLWQALQWTSILEESAQVLRLLRVLTGEG